MDSAEDRTDASISNGDDKPPLEDLPEKTEAGPDPEPEKKRTSGGGPPTSPRKAKDQYPDLNVIYFKVNTDQLKNLSLAQTGTTIAAAFGTFLLTVYFDFTKDLLLGDGGLKAVEEEAEAAGGLLAGLWELLDKQSEILLIGAILSYAFALWLFFWRRGLLARIKADHGMPTIPTKLKRWALKKMFGWLDKENV